MRSHLKNEIAWYWVGIWLIALSSIVQILAFVFVGSLFTVFIFVTNYALFWFYFKKYEKAKAKLWLYELTHPYCRCTAHTYGDDEWGRPVCDQCGKVITLDY